MSPDRRRRGRTLLLLLVGLAIAVGLFVWLAFPWGTIDGLRVEGARVVVAPPDSGRPAAGETPRRIVVDFSTSRDLEGVRRDEGARFINAVLSACADGDVSQRVDVAGGYFREGRVVMLPVVGSGDDRRHRYRATFDDWLPMPSGTGSDFVSAVDVGGGACFSLEGGAMWLGRLWSDRIPLKIAAAPAR